MQPVKIDQEFGFGGLSNLSQGLDRLITPMFFIAGVAVLFYFIYGSFKYMLSGGDKNEKSGAAAMMTHAVVGFLLLMFLFLFLQFLPIIFNLTGYEIVR